LILLEMLTGQPPSHTSGPPVVTVAPAALNRLLGRLLASDPAARPEAATIAAELRAIEADLALQRSVARSPMAPPRRAKGSSARRWLVVVVTLLAAAALIWWVWR
jgi:hypothetical protein